MLVDSGKLYLLPNIENSLKQNGTLNNNCYVVDDSGYYDYRGTFDLDPCRGYPLDTTSKLCPYKIQNFCD